MNSSSSSKKGRLVKWILWGLLVLLIAILGAIGLYAYNNLSWNARLMDHVWKAGYQEKQVLLPNGVKLNYGEGGAANSIPLLLIHGQQVAWEDYARVLPELANSYHVYAVDCHGHGQSSHDPTRYSCQAMTEDFLWFVKNVIGAPCILSGHSSGGLLVSAIAAKAPEYALGLLIEDAPFFCFRPEDMKARNAFVWENGFLLNHRFLSQSQESNYYAYYFEHGPIWQLFGDDLVSLLASSARDFVKAHPSSPFQLWYLPVSMGSVLSYVKDYDFLFGESFYNDTWFQGLEEEPMLRSIQCPVVYLHAKESYMMDGVLTCATPEKDAARAARLIPNCLKVELPFSDHDIHYLYPANFLDGLEQLRSLL